jgi:peptidoglycan/LPS O-acetylase OafA/YrhL
VRPFATREPQTAGRGPSLPYRPDIDGLRAIAVALVIAYHADPDMLPGGFSGVDVFFVISGYLITALVLAGLREGSFTLVGFYQRRVRRIVPPLLLVLGASFAFAWFTLLPGEFRWFGRQMLWSSPFLANVFFARVTGYFDPGGQYNQLLHLWSLGVEEQFYLAWPILLMLAVRYRAARATLGAVVATSFAISVWGARAAPLVHFYLPGARAWELAAGAILAAGPAGVGQPSGAGNASAAGGRWYAHAGSLAGLVLIGAGALRLSADDALPGAWGAIPTAGAALLIATGPHSPAGRLLASSPLVFVGRLSYSLYLWHWPVFAFARTIWGTALPPAGIAGVIALAFVAAWGTYRTVETPVRRGALGASAFPALLAGLVAFTAIGGATAAGRLTGRLSGPAFARWEASVRDWDGFSTASVESLSGFDTWTLGTRRATTTLFIGDSHMQQYWPRIARLLDTHGDTARSVRFAAYDGCPILPGLNSLRQPRNCDGFFSDATTQALRPDVDTVVFGAFWELYLLGEFSMQGHHQGVYSAGDPLRRPLRLDSHGTQVAFAQFERLLDRLVAHGRRVFIVLSNPTSPQFEPSALVSPTVRLSWRYPRTGFAAGARQVDAAAFESYVAPLLQRFAQIAARTGAHLLDPRSTLCAGMLCPAVDTDGTPLYLDSNHVRASYARERASFLDATVLEPETQ